MGPLCSCTLLLMLDSSVPKIVAISMPCKTSYSHCSLDSPLHIQARALNDLDLSCS